MSDDILRYYNDELAFLRKIGREFAQAHQAVAAQLDIGAEGQYDPHAERIVEAAAFLNARLRQKIDDDYPEISGAMLDILYPHYQRPLPSMAIAQFDLEQSQVDLTSGLEIPRHSMLETESIAGQPCRFRTCFPVSCFPIKISHVNLESIPFSAPTGPVSTKAQSVLKIGLEAYSSEVPLEAMELSSLRLFIRAQQPFNFHLYELVMNNLLGVSLARDAQADDVQHLPPDCVLPLGMEADEGMFDYPARSLMGFRLLFEFFAFPEKFLFFEIKLGSALQRLQGPKAELYLFLNRAMQEMENQIDRETLCQGCTPMINLFEHRAEPLRVEHFDSEYDVVPDARRPDAYEVYSVNRVVGSGGQDRRVEFQPFYSYSHSRNQSDATAFWHSTRHEKVAGESLNGPRTKVGLSFVDLDFRPAESASWTMHIETTCCNGDLPSRLPFSSDQPAIQLTDAGSLVRARCLTKPTQRLNPQIGQGSRWRLISFLALNQLSLVDFDDNAATLRELLNLHDYRNTPTTRKMIDGLIAVSSQRVLGRVDSPISGGICRGLEVTLTFDESEYTGGGLFLLASVLERFLGHYTSINSFTQTVAMTKQRAGELRRWRPRAGDLILT